jgi:hypothetical protein
VKMGDVAALVGKGLFAGVAGTAAMTASSMIETKLRGRTGSSAPADAAAKVLGVSPVDEDEKARFGTLVHWGYRRERGVRLARPMSEHTEVPDIVDAYDMFDGCESGWAEVTVGVPPSP